jgi:hypothetical protein
MSRLTLPALAALALVLVSQASPASNAGDLAGPDGPPRVPAPLRRAGHPLVFTDALVHLGARRPRRRPLPVPDRHLAKLPGRHTRVQGHACRPAAETVPRQLPWVTGEPYALWAHVRWISNNGLKATPWSTPSRMASIRAPACIGSMCSRTRTA